MPANVQIGNVEVPVKDFMNFVSKTPQVTFSGLDVYKIASLVDASTDTTLDLVTIKEKLSEGVKFV